MANHIFISYAREDQDYTRKLADHLHQRGFDVWVDDRIDFGDDWWDTIVENLRASDALVVVMTPESHKSKWVRRELLLALRWPSPSSPCSCAARASHSSSTRSTLTSSGAACRPTTSAIASVRQHPLRNPPSFPANTPPNPR